MLFFCIGLAGQQHGIRLTLTSGINSERNETTIDTALSAPLIMTGGKTSFYNISLSYLRKTQKFTLIGGLGINIRKNISSAESNNSLISRNDKIYNRQTGIEVHCGVLKTISTTSNRLEFNIGTGIAFESSIRKKYLSNIDIFDENKNYINGRELKVDLNHSWGIGPTLELSAYYKLVKNTFIGVNFTSWFYFQKESGTEVYSYTFYGTDRVITGENRIDRIINKKLFSKNGVFSYSILLKF